MHTKFFVYFILSAVYIQTSQDYGALQTYIQNLSKSEKIQSEKSICWSSSNQELKEFVNRATVGKKWTLLIHAVASKDIEAAKLLLRLGANPNGSNNTVYENQKCYTITPLSKAIDHESLTMINLLLEHGADSDVENIYVGSVQGIRWTAYQYAISKLETPTMTYRACRLFTDHRQKIVNSLLLAQTFKPNTIQDIKVDMNCEPQPEYYGIDQSITNFLETLTDQRLPEQALKTVSLTEIAASLHQEYQDTETEDRIHKFHKDHDAYWRKKITDAWLSFENNSFFAMKKLLFETIYPDRLGVLNQIHSFFKDDNRLVGIVRQLQKFGDLDENESEIAEEIIQLLTSNYMMKGDLQYKTEEYFRRASKTYPYQQDTSLLRKLLFQDVAKNGDLPRVKRYIEMIPEFQEQNISFETFAQQLVQTEQEIATCEDMFKPKIKKEVAASSCTIS